VVGAKSLLAGILLALAFAAAAAADDPTVRITRADQLKAEAALLKLKDFGVGWSGGKRTPSKLTAPKCPGFDPKESDLTVTGHAEARFTYARGSVVFDQDNQVLESEKAVRTDFARVIQPKLKDCLAYELKQAGKGQIISVVVRELPFPRLGTQSAAYRGTMVLRAGGGRKVTFVSDFIFIGQGRYEYSLNVVAPAVLGGELASFEQSIAQKLVRKAGANVA
jgi:hypothetical protein